MSRRPVERRVSRTCRSTSPTRDAMRQAAHSPSFRATTHVVYAALQESSDLAAGWQDAGLMERNLHMFRHALDPLVASHGATLEHVSLLQGAKAYGLHVGRTPVPAKERAPRDEHDNFYFLQEDALRALADGAPWSWTILRPQVVYGESFGSPMNLVPVLGVYAALERECGRPLVVPGRAARRSRSGRRATPGAVRWHGRRRAGRTGRDLQRHQRRRVRWHDVWPTIAEVFGMEVGDPQPQLLAETMPSRADEWADVVDRYGSVHRVTSARSSEARGATPTSSSAPSGKRGLPALLSTVKIRQAGFADCIDTEDMLREWLTLFQERQLLPTFRG